MITFRARNANQMLPEVMRDLAIRGERRESRNGPVLKFREPVSLQYHRPTERVVFWEERDANPTFHLLEALWMLAGRRDVAFVAGLVPRMASFSDDGQTFNGAYGHRWRSHFGADQLKSIANALRDNPDCRRQVLAIWDGHHDLGLRSVDLPCNTHAYLSRDGEGRLDLMVCNRSNDLVWGALGANVVHFSVMQEYVAALIGCPVGRYWQVTNNLHLYTERHEGLLGLKRLTGLNYATRKTRAAELDLYEGGHVRPAKMVDIDPDVWMEELIFLLQEGPALGMQSRFLRTVAGTLLLAHQDFREEVGQDKYISPMSRVQTALVRGPIDWLWAANEWYQRRLQRYLQKETRRDE